MMPMMVLLLGALLANVLMQVIFCRITQKFFKSMILGFLIGFVFFSFAIFSFGPSNSSLTFFLLYLTLSFCYFVFLNLGETSIRVRILADLMEGNISSDGIEQRYGNNSMWEARLKRLLDSGFAQKKGQNLEFTAPIVLRFAMKVNTWLRQIFNITVR